jgi:4-methoxybenzoate monooxygenase (O-demethylating)
VHAVLCDAQQFSSAAGVGLADLAAEPYGWRKPSLLLEVDPPAHTRHRAVVVGTMNPRAMSAFADSIDTGAAMLAEDLVRRGTFDAVRDMAEVFTTVVFPNALGVVGDTRQALLAYGALSFDAIGPRNQHPERSLQRAQCVLGWIDAHCTREALRPGTIGAAIHEAAAAAGLPSESAALLVRSLFSAGVDTTASALSFAALNFARFPGQWDDVRDDPSLARNAFEEVIRYDSPVIGFFRATTTEVVIGDAHIPPRAKVLVFYAGANRDPQHWPHPDQFDVRRRTAGHLGYGAGPHVCAGMTIARMEGYAVLRALAQRVQRWELTGEPTRRLNHSLRSLASLPVRVTPT